jgi:hypothetical protein
VTIFDHCWSFSNFLIITPAAGYPPASLSVDC